MNTKEKIDALEKEVNLTVEEIKLLLLDIQSFLSEARSPLRSKSGSNNLNLKDDSEKGVEHNGS